jgi:lipopolysaccharide transport system ATP-binding protein
MLDQGISFIYVTHAADAIRSLCNEGLWLEKGKVRLAGAASQVGGAYQSEIFSRMVRAGFEHVNETALKELPEETLNSNPKLDYARIAAFAQRVEPLRTGSGEIRIDDICVIDESGAETDSVGIDEQIRLRVFFHVESPPPQRSVLNVGITDNSGRQILHFNPMFFDVFASDAPAHVPQMMEFTFKNPLCPGEFGVVAGVATLFNNPKSHGQTLVDNVVDYCPGAARFAVRFPDNPIQRDLWGIVHIDYKVSMQSID